MAVATATALVGRRDGADVARAAHDGVGAGRDHDNLVSSFPPPAAKTLALAEGLRLEQPFALQAEDRPALQHQGSSALVPRQDQLRRHNSNSPRSDCLWKAPGTLFLPLPVHSHGRQTNRRLSNCLGRLSG